MPEPQKQAYITAVQHGASPDQALDLSKQWLGAMVKAAPSALMMMGNGQLQSVATNADQLAALRLDFNPDQTSAYGKAFAQFDGTSEQKAAEALHVAQLVGMRQALDSMVDLIPAMPASMQPLYQGIRRGFTAALISKDVYFDQSIDELLPSGVQRVVDTRELASHGLTRSMIDSNGVGGDGYFGALYKGIHNEYYFANRGTEMTDSRDMANDILQGIGRRGEASQYRRAMAIAVKLAAQPSMSDLTFVGHSLGGGLASAQAVATGLHAITFNSAGLHANTVAGFAVNLARAPDLIDAYFVKGETLSFTQDDGKYLAAGGTVAAGHALQGGLSLAGWTALPLSTLTDIAAYYMAEMPSAAGTRIEMQALGSPLSVRYQDSSAPGRWAHLPGKPINPLDDAINAYYPNSLSQVPGSLNVFGIVGQAGATMTDLHSMNNVLNAMYGQFNLPAQPPSMLNILSSMAPTHH